MSASAEIAESQEPVMSYMLRRTLLSKIGLFICFVIAAAGVTADRDSHISLAEPLPQPDWELPLIANGSGTLSDTDLHGRVTYLDFWASWCGPCRAENPNLVKAYNTFKSKNFTILSVSLDNNKDKWLEAIKKDVLTWTHVSDLKYWQNEVAVQFGIQSIPASFILDPTGKIIGRDLRGADLDTFLSKNLK